MSDPSTGFEHLTENTPSTGRHLVFLEFKHFNPNMYLLKVYCVELQC